MIPEDIEGNRKNIANLVIEETLELLEWSLVCKHLSTFASTSQGRKKCQDFSLPSDFTTSQEQLSETLEIGCLDSTLQGGLGFEGIYDLKDVLDRCIKGAFVDGEELLNVADTLAAARLLIRKIKDADSRPILTNLVANLSTFPDIEKLLKYGLEEGGRVADRASDTLSTLRRQSYGNRLERHRRLQDAILANKSFLYDSTISDRSGRPVIGVKAGALEKITGIVHGTSSSGNTIYVEPKEVIELGNRISEIETMIVKEEHRLLKKWSSMLGERSTPLLDLNLVLVQLDFALARARYGRFIGGIPPVISEKEDTPFLLENLRHPILIWQELCNNKQKVVPISFDISNSIKVLAITGPNTGGKTVTLKSIGLAALMARSGLLLPCSGRPSLPWCKNILADIGDEQSLQQSLSTFSGHIIRIKSILEVLKLNLGPSLVLLDEIGAGTDPNEGTALAIALLKRMADKARLTIATTHFGELKALKYSDRRFENASVAFDSETISPKYYLQWGIPGKSNALEIAKRLGLDESVIEDAQNITIPKGLNDVNDVIQGLEEQRNRQQAAAEDASVLLARTEMLHDELLNYWQKTSQQSEMMKEHARQEMELTIKEGQQEVRRLISQLRKKGATGEIARITGKKLRQMESQFQPQIHQSNHSGWQPRIGDRVRLIALAKAGEVIAMSDDHLQLTIQCGMFRSTVSLNEIESLDGTQPQSPKEHLINVMASTSSPGNCLIRTSRNTIDVRGLRVDEAQMVLEEILRKSSGRVWVIHGIGTGRLKRGLLDWLKTVSYVDKVTEAEQHDGGLGCSVIWIR